MPILPSIRPVSPLSNAVTAQGNSAAPADAGKPSKKIGRQLSLNSNGNHYADIHRQEAERALNGGGVSITPQKESFFSHLRKRARRFSGRNQASAATQDIEANPGCMPWSNRSSMVLDPANSDETKHRSDLTELDQALQGVKYSLDTSTQGNVPVHVTSPGDIPSKRMSMPPGSIRSMGDSPVSTSGSTAPISSRTRRAMQMSTHPVHRYETPEEEDELLDEVLHSATKAAKRLNHDHTPSDSPPHIRKSMGSDSGALPSPYPTPSPSAKGNGISFGHVDVTPCKAVSHAEGKLSRTNSTRQWPTPPYEESEWTSTTSTVFATNSTSR